MLDAEFRTKWAEALRSGEYKQAKGVLYNGEGYCCLGVACKISGLEPEKALAGMWKFETQQGEVARLLLPHSLQKALGINGSGTFKYSPDERNTSLADLNDEGFTFEQIAEVIENPNIIWYEETDLQHDDN